MVPAQEVATQSEGLRMRLRLREFLALATVAYLLSILAKTLYPGFYSDISLVYYRNVLPTNNGIPYHDYTLEYPAIPAILIWISGLGLSHESYMATMAFLIFFFVIAAVYFLYRTCVEFGMDRGRIIPFFIIAPSFLVMSFFNWDILAVSAVIAAIYYALKKNSRLSGLCLGLGFAAKSYPLLLLPAFLKETQSWHDRFEMLLSTVLGALIPNLPFIIIDFPAWLNAYRTTYRALYIENSIWLVVHYYRLINQDWLILGVAWSLIILTILHVTFSNNSLALKVWVIVAVTILVYPGYPPQFNLWLLPMFVLSPVFTLIPFLAFDFLNSTIILSWFAVDNPFQPWGSIWDISLIRIGLLVTLVIWATHRGSTPSEHPR
jgi:uncharacterized membrane protein